jgi:hypothetical protein
MAPPTFLNLQNGFYNALSQGLGFPPGSPFQIAQPSPPLVPGINQDQALWNYFNLIPPFTLTNNYVLSPGNQFFNNYSGLLSALLGAPNTFEQDVGPACSAAWLAYANTLPLTVNLNQFPAIFQRWAALHGYISVANKGASDLAAMILDPVSAAQLAIMPYSGSPPNLPNWDAGYDNLVQILAASPSRSFNYDSSTSSSNVSNTWCNGSESAVFGLWSHSSSSSSQSAVFASAAVTLTATFQHVTQFTAVPGSWYSSSAMGDAFSNQSGAPWKPGQPITWKTTFDPTSGNMARFAANIVVASGMSVRVESAASYSESDQSAVKQASSAGLWPFYSSNSDSGTNTSASFDNKGNMTVIITSVPGVPIVLGVNVLPVAQFVGTAVEGAKLHAAALRKKAA